MNNTVLQLIDVTKGFRSAAVLGPVSLSVQSGEIVGVRGKNGAGKSTLIKLMAGILPADSGEIVCPPEVRQATGYVPQDIALYPELSGRDNLRFWADVCKLPRKAADARIGWLLKELNLEDKANKRVSTYSGGMKRRLNLAAALMNTPLLLLLDEPTVGADEESATIMLRFIQKLGERGCAVVFVTHHPEELAAVCSTVVTLEGGLIVRTEKTI